MAPKVLIPLLLLALGGAVAAGLILFEEEAPLAPLPQDETLEKVVQENPEAAEEDQPERTFEPIETDDYEYSEDEEGEEPLLPADDTVRFCMVLDDSGNPVKGAEVGLYRVGRDGRRGGREDWFARMLNQGQEPPIRTVKTNREGLALISPLPRTRFRLVARHGDFEGVSGFERDAEKRAALGLPEGVDAEVRLKPLRFLEVQVREEGGRAISDVDVGVAMPRPEGDRGRGPFGRSARRTSRNLARAVSRDPDGIARIAIGPSVGDLYEAEKVVVAANLRGLERVERDVELMAAGVTRAELDLPPTVTVVLNIRETNDGPLTKESTRVSWNLTPINREGQENDFRRMFTRNPFGVETITGGKKTLGGFAPGNLLRVQTSGNDRVPLVTELELPTGGGTVELTALVGAKQPHVIAHLSEPDGRPAARARFRIEIDDGSPAPDGGEDRTMRFMMRRMNGNRNLRADADGTVRIPVKPGVSGTVSLLDANRRPWGRGQDEEKPVLVLSLPNLEPGEERDLGDFPLDRGPLVVSGRVVDGKGKGINGVRLTVRVDTGDAGDDPMARMRRGRGRGWGGAASGRSEADGSFYIYGVIEEVGDLTIEARDRRRQADPVAFSFGQKDVAVVMRRNGGLRGTIRLAVPEMKARLSVSVRNEAEAEEDVPFFGRGRGRGGARVRPDGTFRFNDLKPGRYRLTASVNGSKALEIGGLEVPEGEVVAPGAIQNLVVGDDFYQAVVHVTDDRGAAIRRARVNFSTANPDQGERGGRRGGRRTNSQRTDENGDASFALRRGEPVTVTVSADGFGAKTIKDAQFPLNVQLLPGRKATVQFTNGLPFTEQVGRFRVSLSPVDANGTPAATSSNPFEMMRGRRGNTPSKTVNRGENSATFDNLSAGVYDVRLSPMPSGRDRNSWRLLFSIPPIQVGRLEIREGGPLETSTPLSLDLPGITAQIQQALDQ